MNLHTCYAYCMRMVSEEGILFYLYRIPIKNMKREKLNKNNVKLEESFYKRMYEN